MPITTVSCIIATCDVDPRHTDREDIGHYETAEEASTDLIAGGWYLVDDMVLCPACACERLGHDWADWRPEGYWAMPSGMRARYCGRCGHYERRPESAVDQAPTALDQLAGAAAPTAIPSV